MREEKTANEAQQRAMRENTSRVRNKNIRVNSAPGHELLKNMGSLLDPRIYNSPSEGSRVAARDVALRSYARRLHCFNKAGKHILFLVTLFTSRKKVKLLAGLGHG